MIVGTVTEAKAQLSDLLERVANGEEIIIGRAGKPVAMLVPYRRGNRPRQPGRLRGKIRIAEDFEVLPEGWDQVFGVSRG